MGQAGNEDLSGTDLKRGYAYQSAKAGARSHLNLWKDAQRVNVKDNARTIKPLKYSGDG